MKCVSTGVMVCLLGISIWGCNSGSRDGVKPRYMGTSAAGVGSGSTANPGSSGVLTAVAVHADLAGGLAPTNNVIVFVNDASLTSPVLTVDSGSGHIDSGATAQTTQGILYFTTPMAQAGMKYQVIGRKSGARVTSNEVSYGTYQNGTITINEPVGDYTGVSNLIPAPVRATWTGVPQNQRSLVLLQNPAGGIDWVATVSFGSYRWGESFADTYKVGSTPLTSGRYKLTVIAIDNSGWGTNGSDKSNGVGQTQQYSFEVQ